MSFDYDLVVIGAGSGGLAAAERATAYGARVAIAEQAAVGGACINTGCIPEKLLDYAASFQALNQAATGYGWNPIDRTFDWSRFIAAKDQQIQRLHQIHCEHLQKAGIEFIQGHAAFLDARTIAIADRSITANKILIATGAKPVKPNISGIEQAITWEELYHLSQLPQRIAVLGNDPIGVKIAGSLNQLGSQVTQIIAGEYILPGCDADLGRTIQARMIEQGVQVLSNTTVYAIQRVDDGFCLTLNCDRPNSITVDVVLVDAERVPNVATLKLDQVGVEQTASGAILIDALSRTTQPNIFAIGDCTEHLRLTPVAIAQGRALADTEFGHKPQSMNCDWIPTSISSHPEAATVGLGEARARKKFGEAVHCYYTQFRPLFYTLTGRDEQVLFKVVVNRLDSERILGIHMVGYGAVEIIQSLALALRMGATKQDLDQAIGIHPSIAEELFVL